MPKAPKTKANNEIAIVQTGGKQYVVSAGDTLKIEKITGAFKKGDKITLEKVLLVDDGANATIGTPYIKGAKVEAQLVGMERAPKVTVIKYKQKSRYFKKRGHRQPYFQIKITSIK